MPIVDNDAKAKIPLAKLFDSNSNPYYIGKYQWPGNLNFKKGVSFMVFISEEGCEELQIGPVDESRSSGKVNKPRGGRISSDRLHIDLFKSQDSRGNNFYLGEARAPMNIECEDGLFFTVFLSRENEEQLQIGLLEHKPRYRDHDFHDEDYFIGV